MIINKLPGRLVLDLYENIVKQTIALKDSMKIARVNNFTFLAVKQCSASRSSSMFRR